MPAREINLAPEIRTRNLPAYRGLNPGSSGRPFGSVRTVTQPTEPPRQAQIYFTSVKISIQSLLTIESVDKVADGVCLNLAVDVNETRSGTERLAAHIRVSPPHRYKHWTIVLLCFRQVHPALRVFCTAANNNDISSVCAPVQLLLLLLLGFSLSTNTTV